MLITVSTRATTSTAGAPTPATDLGYLLHKHPDRVQSFPQSVGTAHVFYPERDAGRCTAALLLEVDPIGLVRGRKGPASEAFALGQYVNDRPYAASSMLAMALKDVFRTALAGRCDARPELAARALPLELHVPALPCADGRTGGPDLLGRLFEPLGWRVEASTVPLDPQFPAWGDSRYLDVRLSGELRLADALNHLYVLLPVLDDAKHYWVSDDEVDKLVRAGAGWLAGHPEKALITRRYLAHRRELTRSAMARLAEVDDAAEEDFDNAPDGAAPLNLPSGSDRAQPPVGQPDGPGPEELDPAVPLHELRRGAVLAAVRAAGARRVGDLGCGEGVLVRDLLAEPWIQQVVAVDVSARALSSAARKLRLDRLAPPQRERLEIFQAALTYRDDRLAGLDAAVLMEVVEHVDPPRLPALERVVFGFAAPSTVIVTTPNVEYNGRFEGLPAGQARHRDHRFEWTRAQFRDWAEGVGARYGYGARFLPVGPDDAEVGPPTQMAVFTKRAGDQADPTTTSERDGA